MLLDSNAVLDDRDIQETRIVDPREVPIFFYQNTPNQVARSCCERLSVTSEKVFQSLTAFIRAHGTI